MLTSVVHHRKHPRTTSLSIVAYWLHPFMAMVRNFWRKMTKSFGVASKFHSDQVSVGCARQTSLIHRGPTSQLTGLKGSSVGARYYRPHSGVSRSPCLDMLELFRRHKRDQTMIVRCFYCYGWYCRYMFLSKSMTHCVVFLTCILYTCTYSSICHPTTQSFNSGLVHVVLSMVLNYYNSNHCWVSV